jgi:hypothetical protein
MIINVYDESDEILIMVPLFKLGEAPGVQSSMMEKLV